MAQAPRNHLTAVIRLSGNSEEQYEAWKSASVWLRKKRVTREGGKITTEDDLTSELITFIVPLSPAYGSIKHFKQAELFESIKHFRWSGMPWTHGFSRR